MAYRRVTRYGSDPSDLWATLVIGVIALVVWFALFEWHQHDVDAGNAAFGRVCAREGGHVTGNRGTAMVGKYLTTRGTLLCVAADGRLLDTYE